VAFSEPFNEDGDDERVVVVVAAVGSTETGSDTTATAPGRLARVTGLVFSKLKLLLPPNEVDVAVVTTADGSATAVAPKVVLILALSEARRGVPTPALGCAVPDTDTAPGRLAR
jgi:hypothetical protein